MKLQPGLTTIEDLDTDAVLREAQRESVPAYILPSTGIVSHGAFFDAVRATLPLDPPLISSRSWDALSDSVWGGLDALSTDRVVIVWPNSAGMKQASPMEYEMALNVLADIAAMLADVSATNGRPKAVSIYLT